MERTTGALEELGATSEIDAVVAVPMIGRAGTPGYQLAGSQLTQVVRHQALRLVEQLHQLPDRTIAVHQLPQQPPPNGVRDELQEPRRIHAPPTGHDGLRHTRTVPSPPYFNQNGLIYLGSELRTVAGTGNLCGLCLPVALVG
jgi:hypothetical protein